MYRTPHSRPMSAVAAAFRSARNNSGSEIAIPLKSRSAINPTCRPLKCKTAPLSLVSAITPPPTTIAPSSSPGRSRRSQAADRGAGPEHSLARAADAGGALRLPEGRDREVVAADKSGEHTAGVAGVGLVERKQNPSTASPTVNITSLFLRPRTFSAGSAT
jgi:hypothetical protein